MKQRECRELKNIRVLIKDDQQTYSGIIINFSKTGMSIVTNHVFPTYKVIDIGIKICDKLIPLKGSVRWVKEPSSPTGEQEEKQFQVGISLQNPSEEYLKYFQ